MGTDTGDGSMLHTGAQIDFESTLVLLSAALIVRSMRIVSLLKSISGPHSAMIWFRNLHYGPAALSCVGMHIALVFFLRFVYY